MFRPELNHERRLVEAPDQVHEGQARSAPTVVGPCLYGGEWPSEQATKLQRRPAVSVTDCPVALARELREELGISIPAPTAQPMREIQTDAFDMQIWLIETWMGSPADVAPDEHDAIAWFEKNKLVDLRVAHDNYLEMFAEALTFPRTSLPAGRILIGS
jgi:8-oxo-dGTP pyrophosphatase MutT (NUDIX family)